MEEQESKRIKTEQLAIKTVHIALILGVILFMVMVSFVLTDPSSPSIDETDDIFNFIVPGIAVLAFFGAKHLSKIPLKDIKDKDLLGKLASYKSSLVVQLTFYQGAATFAIVATLLTNKHIFTSVALIMLVFMFMVRPTKERMTAKLALTPEEVSRLKN